MNKGMWLRKGTNPIRARFPIRIRKPRATRINCLEAKQGQAYKYRGKTTVKGTQYRIPIRDIEL